MILCVNPNAAIDKTAVVPNFRLNEIHRPQQLITLAGGKGFNVARALKCLGHEPRIMCWIGGHAGDYIVSALRREGIGVEAVRTDAESRTCLSILDPENQTLTEVYEQGEPIPPDKLAEFNTRFEHAVAGCEAVTLSGSLPPGVPSDFYAELIRLAHAAHVPALLDASGDALQQGIAARPALVKPNKQEFEDLLGARYETGAAGVPAMIELAQRYETTVIVSLGAEGVICANGEQVIRVRPPRVRAVSAVGSGDALLAGIAFGIAHSFSLEESLRYGVAAGAANALRIGAGVFDKREFDALVSQVTALR